jgi:hypothetical protein
MRWWGCEIYKWGVWGTAICAGYVGVIWGGIGVY